MFHPATPMPDPAVPRLAYPSAPPPTVVINGPNALHAVLTLLTFWAWGRWTWIWLIVALSNRRQVHIVAPPLPPRGSPLRTASPLRCRRAARRAEGGKFSRDRACLASAVTSRL